VSDGGQQPGLGLVLERDRRLMHMTIRAGDTVKAGIVMSAQQVDDTIAGLIKARSRMLPGPAVTREDGTPVREIKGERFDFSIDPDTRELILALEDKGLGWLSFRFGVKLLERMLEIARAVGEG
jgi:hypothetical protein